MNKTFYALTIYLLSQFFLNQYSCQKNRNPYNTESITVKISDQLWMTKNLKVDHFSNGDLIAEAKNFDEWEHALRNGVPSWCYYNFDSLNAFTYGKLYNWHAIKDSRGIAPKGWKIPSLSDWEKLAKNLSIKYPYYSSIDELLMSTSSHWKDNKFGTNLSNFNAEPSGYVESNNFSGLGEIAYFWSSDSSQSVYFQLYYSSFKVRSGSCMDGFDGNGFAIRCVHEESVQIDKNEHIQFDNPYFKDMKYIDQRSSTTIGSVINTDQKDSMLYYDIFKSTYQKPFYLSDHEITNGEYKAFVHWVRDSIAREKLYHRSSESEKKKWGIKTPLKRSGYALNWKTKIDFQDSILDDMYYPMDSRFYSNQRELDTRLLFFNFYDEKGELNRINIYPDTLVSMREFEYSVNYFSNYFWHDAFSNYPVTGITFDQAKAYCVWRTHMYELERSKKKHPYLSVTFRLPTHEEWDQAAVDNLPLYKGIFDSNSDGYFCNYGNNYLSSGIISKYAEDDHYSKQCQQYSFKPNYFGLYNMYGNVSEWVESDLSQQNFYKDYLFTNLFFPEQDSISKMEIFITNPYDGKTSQVIKGSAEHREIIEKRMQFYQITPDISEKDALQLFLKFHSIDEKYNDSISVDHHTKLYFYGHNMLYNPLEKSSIDTLYNVFLGTFELHNFNSIDQYYRNLNFLNDFKKFKQNNTSLNFRKFSNNWPWTIGDDFTLVCGGSWIDPAHYLLPGVSKAVPLSFSSTTIGFRVAADVEGYIIPKEAQKRHKKKKKKKKDDWIFNDK
jgi:uncharacterized protein (TIGR02145 family)